MIRKLPPTFLLFFLVLAFHVVWAQTQGRVEGRVLDEGGRPVEKVNVSVVSQRTSSIHYELSTDKQGRFLQVGLPPGDYVVSAKKEGLAPMSKEVHVSIADTTTVDFSLKTVEAAVERSLSQADSLFLKGNKLYAAHNYPEAAAAYEEAIKLAPQTWGYYVNLGLARKKMDRPDEALAAFKKAVELNPDSISANKEVGEALAKAGNFADAKTYYGKAVTLSPNDPEARYNLALCLSSTGEPEAAMGQLQTAVQLKPDFADAHYQLGTLLIGQNRIPEAIASLEKFLQLAPNHEKAGVAKQLLQALKK